MAFWGAPILDLQHAAHAVEAGLAMLMALDKVNEEFAKEDKPYIKIGVGVNTGTMSVGNMGSRFRRAYTVLGDNVNLGSRLEGLTKAYGVDMIVSEFTKEEAVRFVYREIDRVRVKGKALPVRIFEVVGADGEVPEEVKAQVMQFDQAMKLFRAQQWHDAEKILLDLRQQEPQKELYHIYLERLRHFQANPPGRDWDGVFTHETK
jgi:adenylate cyclase